MRGIFIKIGRYWKPVRFPYITQNGSPVSIKGGWTYQDGGWKQFWPPSLPATVVTIGAGGGRGGDDITAGYVGNPGHRVTSTIGLTSSDRVTIGVGGRGGDGWSGTGNPGGEGGFGGTQFGGGPGGASGALHGWSGSGGGGGGATYLKVNGDLIVVAAGGGGGGGGGLGYVPPPPEPPVEPVIPAPPPPGPAGPEPAPPPYYPPPVPPPPPEPPPPEYPYWGSTSGDCIGDNTGDNSDGTDGGDGGDGDGGGDGGGGSGCFIGSTAILMADGTIKPIATVRVGESLQSDHGTVIVISNRQRFGDVVLISINGSPYFMTSNHAVLTDQGWAVYDIDLLRRVEPYLYQQILADNGFKPLTPLRAGLSLAHWENGVVHYKLIEKLETKNEYNSSVYWLNVSGDNHYVANGIVVHNDS